MTYFCGMSREDVHALTGSHDDMFNHSLALRLARSANGVSRLHGDVSRAMWGKYSGICSITSITNAQNYRYWADKTLYRTSEVQNDEDFDSRKRALKQQAFNVVADQVGKLFDPSVLTIVWARRFAAYKRPDLLTRYRALQQATQQ